MKTNTFDINSMVGKQYKRVDKDIIVTVDSVNEKSKTVIVATPDGKFTSMQSKSLRDKRYWEVVETVKVDPPKPKKAVEKKIEEEKTVIQKPVKKTQDKKTETPKVENNFYSDVFAPMVKSFGAAIKGWSSMPTLFAVVVDNKSKMEVYIGRNKFRIRMYSELVPENVTYVASKYVMDASITLEYNEESYKLLKELMGLSVEYIKLRKSKKED